MKVSDRSRHRGADVSVGRAKQRSQGNLLGVRVLDLNSLHEVKYIDDIPANPDSAMAIVTLRCPVICDGK